MKQLFIYYSYTGNGDVVAEYLQKSGIEIRKVQRKKKLPKSFFWGVLTGGFLAGIKHKDKLLDFNDDIEKIDHIIIGSPIWNARFSSPINTVLHTLKLKDKKVTFVFYAGSGEGPKAFKRVSKEFPHANCVFLKEPKKYPEELKKLEELFN